MGTLSYTDVQKSLGRKRQLFLDAGKYNLIKEQKQYK